MLSPPFVSEPASEQEDGRMTHMRSWLALTTLLAALVGGTIWAAEQEKAAPKAQAPDCCAEGKGCCTAKPKDCCADDCCTKEKACCSEASHCTAEKTCCEGKCCAQE